jgi:hypothetical protein
MTPTVSRETIPGAQNMKSGADTPLPPKTSPGAQNMKTGHDALDTAENECGSVKHENGSWRPPYRRKRVRELKIWKRDLSSSVPPKKNSGAQNMNTGADAHGTAENESGSAKHKNKSLCPPHRQKHVWKRKTWKRDWTPSVPSKMSTARKIWKRDPLCAVQPTEYGGPNWLGLVSCCWAHTRVQLRFITQPANSPFEY